MADTPSVTVRFFAAARAAAGTPEEHLEIRTPCTVATLVEELTDLHGTDLARVLAVSSFLVDELAGDRSQSVSAGSVVDVLPPFAGG